MRERRSGFQPFADASEATVARLSPLDRILFAIRQRPVTLLLVLATVNLCNLGDFYLTLRVLALGHGEANPVMNTLFGVDPVLAGVFKVGICLGVSFLVWFFRRYRAMLLFSLIVLFSYTALMAYHLYGGLRWS
mgnify:CR=1 FL=1